MAKSLSDSFPSQVKYIVGTEGCERYSFYGMRSILTVFMVEVLLFSSEYATEVLHLFIMACYLLPLLGSFLADRFLGRYYTILYLSLFYCIGHGILAAFESPMGLYWGLGLVALGAGGIKPCISAFVGDQFKSEQKHLLAKVYSLFYFMINFGSTFSSLLTPLTLKYYGPGVAFGIPGILMGIATFVFWLGRDKYVKPVPSGSDPHSVWSILWTGFKGLSSDGFNKAISKKHPAARVEEFYAAINVVKIFAFVSVFWALFDQHASTWILQGKKMEQLVNVPGFLQGLFGEQVQILPSQMQALNPILVLILIPIFIYGIYPTVSKIYEMTPLRKMSIGMILAGVAYSTVAFIQYPIDNGQPMHILWQIIPYFFMTVAEVMVSITGLEFAFTQAPKSLKSTIMSFWLLTVFAGNFLTVVFVMIELFPLGSGNFFMYFAGLMFITGILFALYSRNYKMRDYMSA